MHRIVFVVSTVAVLWGALAAPAVAAGATCRGRAATIVGTPGSDTLTGTAANDVIAGLAGSDTIDGGGGSDLICAGNGHDVVYGGDGADFLWGDGGNDRMGGQGDNDYLNGLAGADHLYGAEGRDQVAGSGGDDYLDGGDGNDSQYGGTGADELYGREGGDRLVGERSRMDRADGWGDDRIYGGSGMDWLEGGRGADHTDGGADRDTLQVTTATVGVQLDLTLSQFFTTDGIATFASIENARGTSFHDVIKGTDGPNKLYGSFHGDYGSDDIEGRGGNDVIRAARIWGGDGNDFIVGNTVWGGEGADRMHARESMSGEGGDDVLYLDSGYSSIKTPPASGGAGDDRFELLDYCDPGDDCQLGVHFAGGDGTDVIAVEEAGPPILSAPYIFDLPAGTVSSPGRDLAFTLDGFETVVGTANTDTIIGTDAPELLLGGLGDDTIRGGGGDDILAGGTRALDDGQDTVQGGTGEGDDCYTSSPPYGAGPQDLIGGCESVEGVPHAK